MAVMANYPIYKNLQDTTKEINAVLDSVQVEIKSWQEELLKIEKDKRNLIKYVKNLSKLLNTDLSFDGQIFKLDGKNVKQSEIENMLLVDCNG